MCLSSILHCLLFFVFCRFFLSSRRDGTTPDLLLPLKRRRFRQPSPHRRVAGPFRLWLIGSTYRPSDGGGLHRSCLRTIFSRRRHASPAGSTAGIRFTGRGEGSLGFPPALHRGAVTGAPSGRKCRLPESPRLAPSSRRLLRASRWRRAGCLPPSKVRSAGKVFCTGAVPHR